jgi:CBS domain-containing protein
MKFGTGANNQIVARDMMVTRLHTFGPDERVYTVVRKLLKYGVSGAPVVDKDHNLVGILSEQDCIHALLRALHSRLPSATVADAMTSEPITVTADADFLTVAHLFVKTRVRRIPVVAGPKLLGQISRRDLLKAATRVFDKSPDRDAALLYLSALRSLDDVPPLG